MCTHTHVMEKHRNLACCKDASLRVWFGWCFERTSRRCEYINVLKPRIDICILCTMMLCFRSPANYHLSGIT